MFANLIASQPKGRSLLSPTTWGLSTLTHVLLGVVLLALAGRTADAPESRPDRDVTWVDVAETAAPEPVADHEPPPAAPEPFEPEPPPEATPRPELPAGFQELQLPPEVKGIPEPVIAAPPVLAADYRGRGIAGGVSAGRRISEPAPAPEAAPTPPQEEALSIAVVDVLPRVLDAERMGPRMRELYPAILRSGDVEGRALAEFVVDAEGRVEPESVKILEATHPQFEGATRALVLLVRWEPARRNGRPVRVWVRMPVDWKINR